MTLEAVRGQEPAIRTLVSALRGGRLHHAYRFEGPRGVGKRTTAFALAQALLCDTPEGGLGCGGCRSCLQVVTRSEEAPFVPLHPDVLLVQRGLYPEEVLGSSETAAIGIEQIRRVVLARASRKPHGGRALVCIVLEADELSLGAANALLKTLEEPRPALHFVLTTSRPARLLDTIRSRTLPVRFGPLADAVLADLLGERDADPSVVPLAEGSVRLALELGEPTEAAARAQLARAVLAALDAPRLGGALEALSGAPTERLALQRQLGEVARAVTERCRAALASGRIDAARAWAEGVSDVFRARDELEANAAPALCLESLVLRLRARSG